MAQLRKFQFFRNGAPVYSANVNTHELAINAALTQLNSFAQSNDINILDGEIVLYRYKLTENGDVHTIVGVAHGEGEGQSFEIIANYDMVQAIVATINTQIEALDDRMEAAEGDIDSLEGRMDTAEDDIDALEGRMEAAEITILAHTESITNLDGRMTTAEGKITTAEGKITSLEGRMDTAEDDIDALEGRMTTAEGKITSLEGRMDTAENDIDALEADIAGMNHTHTDVNTDYTTFKIFAPKQSEGQVSEAVDGIITFNQSLTESNKAATMADVNAAIEATTYTQGNGISISDDNKISAKVADGEQVLSVDGDGLKTTIGIEYDETNKEIKLVGIDGVQIGDAIDATDFVVDGMLSNAELKYGTLNGDTFTESTEGEPYLVLTFNADGTTQGAKTIYVPVKDLVDVYTADEVYLTVSNNKFSHKELHTTEKTIGEITSGNDGNNAATVEEAADQISFKVPTLTIDKAGHVKTLNEYKVNITLPKSIGTALQGVSATGDNYITAAFAEKDGDNKQALSVSAVIGNYAETNQIEGLATTTATKTYVDSKIQALDDSMTTVTEGTGISVSDTGTGNDHAYTVALAEAKATVTNDTDDYVAANGTHTRISDITVDDYGRVTAVTKITVTENWDCGTY